MKFGFKTIKLILKEFETRIGTEREGAKGWGLRWDQIMITEPARHLEIV
jgi:hypothetical protein